MTGVEPEDLPTGRQHVLVAGDLRAVVVEVGGGLRELTAAGRPLVDGYAADEEASGGRGAVLAPWPNRVRDGRYTWDGAEQQLPLSEPATSTAIHGLVRHVGWRTQRLRTDAVRVAVTLHPQKGWPFTLRLRLDYRLHPGGLDVEVTARNTGARDLPFGFGQHPYLAVPGGGLLDGCTLRAPGAVRLETDDRGLPTGERDVAGTPYDFREPRQVGDLRLDTAYRDLRRDADGRARVRLTGPDGGGAELWVDERVRWLQLFSGDTVSPPSRRRRGLGVEPMTCPPDALASGTDLRRLAPGEETGLAWGVVPLG